LINGQRVDIVLDLKPALSEEQLVARLERTSLASSPASARQNLFDASEGAWHRKNLPLHQAPTHPTVAKPSTSLLNSLMPKALIPPFQRANPDLSLENLPQRLKSWAFPIMDYKGYERAVVTAGGVSLKEIVPKTMASRLRPGLFFCGEVLDLDGDTGGYNLQIAFSTGSLAGLSAANYLLRCNGSI
jgi:hypothetical protein